MLKDAKSILKEKNIEITEENIKKIINNLEKRQNRRYHAVCIEFDELLEEQGKKYEELKENILKLLNKHIPIIFITDMDEKQAKEKYRDILNELMCNDELKEDLIRNVIILANDGAFLIETDENFIDKDSKQNNVLNNSKLLLGEKDIEILEAMKAEIKDFFIESKLNIDIVDHIYESKIKYLTGFEILIQGSEQFNKLKKFINYYISLNNRVNTNFKIKYSIKREGMSDVYKIILGNKEDIFSNIERILGISENLILRIGSRGNTEERDFFMLNSDKGYSIDTYSNDINNCYPIIDNNGKILKGIDGINYVLKESRIFPTICLKRQDKERYTRQLAISERNINLGKQYIISRYNNIINDTFSINEGFEDVFDKKSGAIIFKDWQWELIDDRDELKQLFKQKINNGYKYILNTDNAKLLRGSDTYYYFLANKTQKEPDKKLINEWFANYMNFFMEAYSIMVDYKINDRTSNLKLMLGLLDNMRNISLINLNSSIVSKYQNNKSLLLSLDTYEIDDDIKEWYEICNSIYTQMENICFNKKEIESYPIEISKILSKIIEAYTKIVKKVTEKNNLELNKRCFRTYREIDNFIENFITINMTIEKLNEENINFFDKEINFSGMSYGGIELPLLARKILTKYQCNIDTSTILIKKDGYDQLHSDDFFENLVKQDMEIVGRRNYRNGFNILSDDNVLTGVTLQAALELLFSQDININNLAVVRYPSINRIEHMFAKNRGAINTLKFTTYIKGLIFPSPYSKINPGDSFLDELGIFNKSRDRILRYLYKNGRYRLNSEVDRTIKRTEREI